MTVRVEQDRLVLEGALTGSTIAGMLDEGRAAIRGGVRTIKFSGAGMLDSAAIALLLDWTRIAQGPLALSDAPSAFVNLAKLYGVEELFQFA